MNDLFPKPARKKRRVMMHVIDAGAIDGIGRVVIYQCGKCRYTTNWTKQGLLSDAKRGKPCPTCNKVK